MAEMTVAQAQEKLFEKVFLDNETRVQIAAIIEQQAAEIAKKDRMIVKAIDVITTWHGNTHLYNCYCPRGKNRYSDCENEDNCSIDYVSEEQWHLVCKKCWLAWLEKEAQGVE